MEQADVRGADRPRAATSVWFGRIVIVSSSAVALVFLLRAWASWAGLKPDFRETLITVGVGCTGIFLAMLTILCWRAASDRAEARVWKWSFCILAAAGAACCTDFALDTPARAARRAQPIAEAILRYQAERGAAPKRLEDLVPTYLQALPNRFTRRFGRAHYYEDPEEPRGFGLVVSGSVFLSVATLELRFEPGAAPIPRGLTDLVEPRRIGDWVLRELDS